MERLIHLMQDEKSGVPIRTVKSFMSKIPSVFAGEKIMLSFKESWKSLSSNFLLGRTALHITATLSKLWLLVFSLLFVGSDLVDWIMCNLSIEDRGITNNIIIAVFKIFYCHNYFIYCKCNINYFSPFGQNIMLCYGSGGNNCFQLQELYDIFM